MTSLTRNGLANRVLITAAIVGVMATLAGFGTYSAFSSTTTNPGNTFATGTVAISDNDAGAALYNVSGAKPGSTTNSCIKVTYTGSLDSSVKLYIPSAIGTVGQYTNLTITPGTQTTSTFPSCTGFTPATGGSIYSGTLANFASTYNSYANGLATNPAGASKWVTNDAIVYQVSVGVQDNDAAQGLTSGTHSYVWQAQNQ